jgi:hypothetical protein
MRFWRKKEPKPLIREQLADTIAAAMRSHPGAIMVRDAQPTVGPLNGESQKITAVFLNSDGTDVYVTVNVYGNETL